MIHPCLRRTATIFVPVVFKCSWVPVCCTCNLQSVRIASHMCAAYILCLRLFRYLFIVPITG